MTKHFICAIIFILILAFILSIAYRARREQANRLRVERLLHDLEVSHRQLQAYAEKVAGLAAIEERNRLARDIHDGLGHYLTVINVQLEKAMAFRDRAPEVADQAVRDAKRLAGEALQDVRRSVYSLRNSEEPFSLVQAVTGLVDNMRRSQFSVDMKIEGSEEGFSHQSLMTLYRAAQESLTNVKKHAQASHTTMSLELGDQQASLCISDDGQGFDTGILHEATPYFGLRGVRERLELVGGTLELDSIPGKGTRLTITVPRNPPLTLRKERM